MQRKYRRRLSGGFRGSSSSSSRSIRARHVGGIGLDVGWRTVNDGGSRRRRRRRTRPRGIYWSDVDAPSIIRILDDRQLVDIIRR